MAKSVFGTSLGNNHIYTEKRAQDGTRRSNFQYPISQTKHGKTHHPHLKLVT